MSKDSRSYALITGAGSGLGQQMALELARRGWHVGVADLSLTSANETLKQIQQAGGTAEAIELDVRKEQEWQSVKDRLTTTWPKLDLLVNNAGVSASGEIGQASIEDWDWVMSINLRGVFLGCHTMADWLKSNPGPSYILYIASAAGLFCAPGMVSYNVSKAAVIALSESILTELKPHNVFVTVACPWFIRTNLLNAGRFTTTDQKKFAESAMSQARVTPEQFARTALDGTFKKVPVLIPTRKLARFVHFKRLFPGIFRRQLYRMVLKHSAKNGQHPNL